MHLHCHLRPSVPHIYIISSQEAQAQAGEEETIYYQLLLWQAAFTEELALGQSLRTQTIFHVYRGFGLLCHPNWAEFTAEDNAEKERPGNS